MSGGRRRRAQTSLRMKTYSHVLPSLQEEAAAKMNAILSR